MTVKTVQGIHITILLFLCALYLWGCANPTFNHTTTLHTLTVHIVGSREQFPSDSPYLMGLCRGNEIWVLGRKTPDGKIYVNEGILGHEMLHVLQHNDVSFLNPDIPVPLTMWH